jgi:putative tricarboxylic transport membrane protein
MSWRRTARHRAGLPIRRSARWSASRSVSVARCCPTGYGLGSFSQPGTGLWPFIVSALIAVLSAVLLVIGRGLTDSEEFTRSSALPAIGVVTFIAFGLLMPVTGFEIPALVLCVIWLRFLGGESWRNTILIGVATTAAFYFLFLYGLQIPVPHLIAF